MAVKFSACTMPSPPSIRAIFSDLDGTLVHFPVWFEQHGVQVISRDPEQSRIVVRSSRGEERACRLLPATTMYDGIVSERTVELIDSLRKEGLIFVIVTGARKSTLLQRIPLLPLADASVGESGSRIYVHDVLDEDWAAQLAPVCGPIERELPPEQRPEPLWQFFRLLLMQGFKMDSRSYYGCFRVDAKGDDTMERRLRQFISSELPPDLDWAINLGKFDFFPRASGKHNAVIYLQKRFGLRPEECVCLFDDDNDLGMAQQCGVHLLPALTSRSVERAAAENPTWQVASRSGEGVFAIEELLEQLLQRVRAEHVDDYNATPPSPRLHTAITKDLN
mmetsp:Transcript_37547/g.62167  ORF Transcript_37547/g.62167 Transcript_37547/m.62167 type:complete len:335 (-) Transcript_37547:308-1312(-)